MRIARQWLSGSKIGVFLQPGALFLYELHQFSRWNAQAARNKKNGIEGGAKFALLKLKKVNPRHTRIFRQTLLAEAGLLAQTANNVGDSLIEKGIIFHFPNIAK